MASDRKMGEKHERSKICYVPNILLNDGMKNNQNSPASLPTSPVGLRKTGSVRHSCLCSPTTHAGSFRCRFHRNEALIRSSMSVGSKLSELAGK
ncbi:hypothetical protein F511_08852 [Dorcoceras hygrometricum]|uniref:Uncharacterized protein n=1 Tax=Dorcoceras hygrometricum TaxID=472368 RepID=A0A2Z7AHX6_9LAMI|nr:hypothetical protein F511_08852 [Dorcoceras hygrometricum]